MTHILSLILHLHTPLPPSPTPRAIIPVLSKPSYGFQFVDVKHYVYLLAYSFGVVSVSVAIGRFSEAGLLEWM